MDHPAAAVVADRPAARQVAALRGAGLAVVLVAAVAAVLAAAEMTDMQAEGASEQGIETWASR